MKFSILAFGAVLVALVSGLAIPNPEAAVEERGIYSVGRQPVCEEDVATEDGEYRLPSCSCKLHLLIIGSSLGSKV
jgi:hypothetical protein